MCSACDSASRNVRNGMGVRADGLFLADLLGNRYTTSTPYRLPAPTAPACPPCFSIRHPGGKGVFDLRATHARALRPAAPVWYHTDKGRC